VARTPFRKAKRGFTMPLLCHGTLRLGTGQEVNTRHSPFSYPISIYNFERAEQPATMHSPSRQRDLALRTPSLYTLPLEFTRPITSSDSRTRRRWRSVESVGNFADFPSGDMPPGESYSDHGYNYFEHLRCVFVGCGDGARGLERRTQQRSSYQTIHLTHLAGSSVVLVAMSWFLLRRRWSRRRCS
jgi:hypothetical protein